jgi:hypothetical protein
MTDILPFEFQPSFLEKSMFSIKGGDSEDILQEDANEFRAGYPIQFSENIHGGSGDSKHKMVEGLSKIKHLSVPLGLVVNSYKPIGGIKFIEPTELIEPIQDKKFNEIFELTQPKKHNKTKKHTEKKSKRITIRKKIDDFN